MKSMRYKWCFFILCALSMACSTSNSDKPADRSSVPDWLSKRKPEYDKERQVIYYKEQLKQDIKGDIAVPLNVNSPNLVDYACQFSFFNYGEDICLFKGCGDDFFISGIGTINFVSVLKSEDNIEIVNKRHSEKYGDWALVNLTIGNNYINDVYMTPLSMKAYKEGDDDSYIFIQFVASNKYMNVLFYGGPEECIIINHCPNVILLCSEPSFNIDGPKNGPGQFWHQLY